MVFETLSSDLLGLALAACIVFAINFRIGLFILSIFGIRQKLGEIETALVGVVVIAVAVMLWFSFR
jgi:hypothetical protein